jgi:hypothetical protein
MPLFDDAFLGALVLLLLGAAFLELAAPLDGDEVFLVAITFCFRFNLLLY